MHIFFKGCFYVMLVNSYKHAMLGQLAGFVAEMFLFSQVFFPITTLFYTISYVLECLLWLYHGVIV